jgi:prenylcysteine oxidase/farnesylcysteine lyase
MHGTYPNLKTKNFLVRCDQDACLKKSELKIFLFHPIEIEPTMQWNGAINTMKLFPILLFLLLQAAASKEGYRIAVIGGGISGSFVTKYLSDFDVHGDANGKDRERCLIDEIVVYDVSPPPSGFSDDEQSNHNGNNNGGDVVLSSSDPRPENWQGSRVSAITIEDTVIELGASIIYDGNQLVVDMMNGDPDNVERDEPMGTSKKEEEEGISSGEPYGFGIYHGNKEWLLKTNSFANYPSFLRKMLVPLTFLWRYNFDYFRLQHAVKRAVHAFDIVYKLLNDTKNELTYFDSPMELWDAIELRTAAAVSFHDLLDGLGLYRDARLEMQQETTSESNNSWWDWRQWLPGMGCMRSELVTAMTINTYNADLNEMNGLVGLVSYVPSSGELFSVKGGNNKLIESAMHQSRRLYETASNCKHSTQRIQWQQKQITTVISNGDTMELLSNEESLGEFDIVILAAPLQQCRVQFLIQNPMGMDSSILHPMPLGGVHANVDNEDDVDKAERVNNEHGDLSFATPLPPSATTPYTRVVTTIISNATLNTSHFGLDSNEPLPRTILVSERGKMLEGITTLRILSVKKGLVKTFSTEELSLEHRNTMFGDYHTVEYVQSWGGGGNIEQSRYGGATPNFDGGRNSESLPFLLYDASAHLSKSDGAALYYVNAIESAVAAIEISAIGAKSVAKLVARRLGLVSPVQSAHDEL